MACGIPLSVFKMPVMNRRDILQDVDHIHLFCHGIDVGWRISCGTLEKLSKFCPFSFFIFKFIFTNGIGFMWLQQLICQFYFWDWLYLSITFYLMSLLILQLWVCPSEERKSLNHWKFLVKNVLQNWTSSFLIHGRKDLEEKMKNCVSFDFLTD